MLIPSIKDVRKELVKEHKHIRKLFPKRESLIEDDSNFSGVDVRLQVIVNEETTIWAIHAGDLSFDQSHRGYWGSSLMTWERENLEAIARSLVEQVKYHMQECAG